MTRRLFSALAIVIAFAGTAIAQRFPDHYPADGFQRTGQVDAVYLEENRIVIGDISYQISNSVVVHSLSSKNDTVARLRPGAYVGFTMDDGRVISEVWLLPGNYKKSGGR